MDFLEAAELDEMGSTPAMEDEHGPIVPVDERPAPDYVIIEVASAHPSAAIIVVQNAPGLQAAIKDRRETHQPQSLKAWLRQQGFHVLNAVPLALAEEPRAADEVDEVNRRIDAGETPAEATDTIDGGRCCVCGRFHAHSWKTCAEERAAFDEDTRQTMLDAVTY